MMPFQMIDGGRFLIKDPTQPVLVPTVSAFKPDYLEAKCIGSSDTTGWGQLSSARQIELFFEKNMTQGTARGVRQLSDATNPTMVANVINAGGISFYKTTPTRVIATFDATTIASAGGTYVVSMADTGTISVGDFVRLVGITGARQINGYVFEVTAVTANTSITLGKMATSGTTFPNGSAAKVQQLIVSKEFPRTSFIANVTNAVKAKMFFTARHDYELGQVLSFRIGENFGMQDLNGSGLDLIKARVVDVTNSASEASVVLDLDTTAFTAFAFPTDAQAGAKLTTAIAVPSSSGILPVDQNQIYAQPPQISTKTAWDNRNENIIRFGTGCFAGAVAGEIWIWKAYKYDDYKIIN